jgi:hypothetical protein
MTTDLVRRLKRLEHGIAPEHQARFRLIVSRPWKRLDLAKSTCTRCVCHNGVLTEIVHVEGDDAHISDGDLEEFIQSFPIGVQR